ncbi:MAG TPA: P-loop NTPase fold protein [Prosthecobacter sp.]|nr:P-loop NTPase fold protein [Prosthecobacter sp.]
MSSPLPLVFISASHQNIEEREMLKAALEVRAEQIEWWDDSRVPTGERWEKEIDGAINRASAAIILLSQHYIGSKTAVAECRRLAHMANAGVLQVFPVVLEECAWKEVVPELGQRQFWNMGRPVGKLPPPELAKIWRELSANVAQVAKRRGSPAAPAGSPTVGDGDTPPAPVRVETAATPASEGGRETPKPPRQPEKPDYQFSPSALRVLERARALAQETGRPRVTSSCLLFGLTESADESTTAGFLRDVCERNGGYARALEAFWAKYPPNPWDDRGGDVPPWSAVTANVDSILKFAAEVRGRLSPMSRVIETRHLVAGILDAVAKSTARAEVAFAEMDVDHRRLREEFREFVRWRVAGDDPRAWDEVLGTTSPDRWPLEQAIEGMSLRGVSAGFLRRLARAGGWLNRPADTFAALAYGVLDAERAPIAGGAAILDALRQGHPNGNDAATFPLRQLLTLPQGSPEDSDEVYPNGVIAEDLIEAHKLCLWISRQAGGESLSDSVFFAVLLAKQPPVKYASLAKLEELKFDLGVTRARYRIFLAERRQSDPQARYDDLLGVTYAGAQALLAAHRQSGMAANPYRQSYAYFAPDHSDGDELGVGTYAGHLAKLIAAEATAMPLSIGLFGRWGSGKSHFMKLLEAALVKLTKGEGKTFHKHIVQIRFNAWHYLDTNLWASLVCEIFDQLFKKLDRSKEMKEQVQNLKEELTRQGGLAAEADLALDAAKKARTAAEGQLQAAQHEQEAKRDEKTSILQDLATLAAEDQGLQQQLAEVAVTLGVPALAGSATELERQIDEMRSLGGRARALYESLRTGRRWPLRLAGLVAVVVVAPLVMAALIVWAKTGPQWLRDFVTEAKALLQAAAALVGVVAAWLAHWWKVGRPWLEKVESAHKSLREIRARTESKDVKVNEAQAALTAARQAEEEAARQVAEAQARIQALNTEIAELAPGRVMMRFLTERAGTGDYRKHLGLVSLIRRDFQQLSDLLAPKKAPEPQPGQDAGAGRPNHEEEKNLPKIERIVLYIDDLDRCSAARVIEVLEAVHLLLAFPLFTVVVAVDPRWLRQSLLDRYSRLLGGGQGEAPGREPEERRRAEPASATPQDYLEKIFQVPFNLRPMEKEGFDSLVEKLFVCEKEAAEAKRDEAGEPRLMMGGSMGTGAGMGAEGHVSGEGGASGGDPGDRQGVRDERPLNSEGGAGTAAERTKPQDAVALKAVGGTEDAGEGRATETAKVDEALAEQRLLLKAKERADVKRFLPLFSTPRAVKRMSNTYALIRVGVDAGSWETFIGPGETAGEYRVPMLMLAVASGFPSLAGSWLQWLQETAPGRWMLGDAEIADLTARYGHAGDEEEWRRLGRALDQMMQDAHWPPQWPSPTRDRLKTWVPAVARYSF